MEASPIDEGSQSDNDSSEEQNKSNRGKGGLGLVEDDFNQFQDMPHEREAYEYDGYYGARMSE